jgi:tetratricopeptide (TPR) repeat protein
MNMELHYDEESLAALAGFEDLDTDEHLQSCETCREKLDSFRLIADALGDAGVWNHEPLPLAPVPSTLNVLRSFASQMASEDAQAERWLPLLLSGPRETWATNLAHHPEYRTAGMVRAMVAACYPMLDKVPADALELTALATEIADHLDDSEYPKETVLRLRGQAWRDRAYVLCFTGRIGDAKKAVEIADRHLSGCAVDEFDRARVNVVAALIERLLDQTDYAISLSRQSAGTFLKFGDAERHASAVFAEGAVLLQTGRFERALQAFLELEKTYAWDDSSDARAGVLSNLGMAYRNLNRFDEAIASLTLAADIYETRGTKSDATRTRLNVANLLAATGKWEDAARLFSDVRAQFKTLALEGDAATAALDLAEIRLIQGRQSDVVLLCNEASEYFRSAGLAYTTRALRAIAYMREAAEAGRATPELARGVRDYLRQLPSAPDLLFLHLDDRNR